MLKYRETVPLNPPLTLAYCFPRPGPVVAGEYLDPLPQHRTGPPPPAVQYENTLWNNVEYSVLWRQERALFKPSTECAFGSLTTEVLFNNSIQGRPSLHLSNTYKVHDRQMVLYFIACSSSSSFTFVHLC